MSQSDQLWRYAEAAMLGACCLKNETEKRALLDLTRTLAKAALESEGGTDASKTSAELAWCVESAQPLSIQAHPDDTFAHAIGLPNGKTEAWYVLSAAPDAKVAIGLQRRLTPQQLRAAIADCSISGLVAWRAVSSDDFSIHQSQLIGLRDF